MKKLQVFLLLHILFLNYRSSCHCGGLILVTCTNRKFPNFSEFKTQMLFIKQVQRRICNTED